MSELKLEIGKTYLNRYGSRVTIQRRIDDPCYKFVDSNGETYKENGHYSDSAISKFDLIALAPDERLNMGESVPLMSTDWPGLATTPRVELTFVRVHPDAQLPTYATGGSACFDLHAVDIGGFTVAEHEVLQRAYKYCDELVIGPGESATIRTGLKVEVPPGWRMDIYSRSGHGFNRGVRLGNCVGKIDSDYRGEILVNLRNDGTQPFRVRPGDRIAQAELNPVYRVSFKEVGELSETARGEGGFGSTGV